MNSSKYRGDIVSKIVHRETLNIPYQSHTQPVIINTEYDFNNQLKYIKILKKKNMYDDNENYKYTVVEHHLHELPIQNKDIQHIEFMNRNDLIKENVDKVDICSFKTKDEILKIACKYGFSNTEKKKYAIEIMNRIHSNNIKNYYSDMKKWNGSKNTKPKYPIRYKIHNSEYY